MNIGSINVVRTKKPLVHAITNYVTVNDCANILLATGASPVMADDPREVQDIQRISQSLVINIGTLNERTIESMILAGKAANALGHPVILDPVGVGASGLRTETGKRIVEEVQCAVIRGNISEIKGLVSGNSLTHGVDAADIDLVNPENMKAAAEFAKAYSKQTGAVIVISGPIDIIADADKAYAIHNGHSMMGRVTGTGCQLTALLGAFVGAQPEQPWEAAIGAVATMGISGELAHKRLSILDGNVSYRNYIIDAVYHMDDDTMNNHLRGEEISQ